MILDESTILAKLIRSPTECCSPATHTLLLKAQVKLSFEKDASYGEHSKTFCPAFNTFYLIPYLRALCTPSRWPDLYLFLLQLNALLSCFQQEGLDV